MGDPGVGFLHPGQGFGAGDEQQLRRLEMRRLGTRGTAMQMNAAGLGFCLAWHAMEACGLLRHPAADFHSGGAVEFCSVFL